MDMMWYAIGAWAEWLPFSIYYIAGIPQIITNYRSESTAGLSYRMVFFDYTGNLTTTIYTYLLGLPLACKVMEPLCVLNIGILVYQGYLYTRDGSIKRNILLAYTALHAFCVVMIVVGYWYHHEIGNLMGWLSLLVQTFTQLPQVLKNRRRRSVQGLSFAYVNLFGLACTLEMLIAWMMGLPMQSFLNGLRGVCYYTVFCCQFYRYRDTVKRWW